jgi:transcription elongation GreA/GreB family factor
MPETATPPATKALLVTRPEYDALLAQLDRRRAERDADPAADVADQIVQLETAAHRAVVAYPDDAGYLLVAVGTVVDVDDGRRRCRYRLAFDVDVPGEEGTTVVSAFSPVGLALVGRAPGDVVDIALPDGRVRSLRVVRIGTVAPR